MSPLNHGLIDTIYCHPGEITPNYLGPKCVSDQNRWIKVEKLDSFRLKAELEYGFWTTFYWSLTKDNNNQAGCNHANCLKDIGPNDSFNTTQTRVENANQKSQTYGKWKWKIENYNVRGRWRQFFVNLAMCILRPLGSSQVCWAWGSSHSCH